RFVEVHRNLQAIGNLAADRLRNFDTIPERDAADRYEWNDVGCAESRMFSLMSRQINMSHGNLDTTNGSFTYRFRRACERNDGAVMVRVHLPAQQINTF